MNDHDFVGIEFEYTDIPQKNRILSRVARNFGWQIVHDASIESPSFCIDNVFLLDSLTFDKNVNSLIRKATIGGELVSPVLNTSSNSWLKQLSALIYTLKLLGERSRTSRGSIHIHVNAPHDNTRKGRHYLKLLKSLFALALFTEGFFYKIGGLGQEHRGRNADYIYYRWLTKNGPPVVNSDGNSYRLLNSEQILASSGCREFYIKFGDIWGAEGRYHPSRYLWINFYNMVHFDDTPHLEFRVFNKTVQLDYLYAIVELCKAFLMACYENKDLHRELGGEIIGLEDLEENNTDYYFYSCLEVLNIDPTDFVGSILKEIWDKTPIPETDDSLVFSHLNSRNRMFGYTNSRFLPPIVDPMKVREPFYVDIHFLNRRGEVIFPGRG